MSKRNHDLHLRLNDTEFEKLDRLVRKSGLSRESYLRQIISGLQPRDQPPPDYHGMMRQLYHCGNSLNQVARKAHALNVVDIPMLENAIRHLEGTLTQIELAVIEPERIRYGNHENMAH